MSQRRLFIGHAHLCPCSGFEAYVRGKRNDDEELERQIFGGLKKEGVRWLEAIVWNLRGPCDVQDPELVIQAKFIQGGFHLFLWLCQQISLSNGHVYNFHIVHLKKFDSFVLSVHFVQSISNTL